MLEAVLSALSLCRADTVLTPQQEKQEGDCLGHHMLNSAVTSGRASKANSYLYF